MHSKPKLYQRECPFFFLRFKYRGCTPQLAAPCEPARHALLGPPTTPEGSTRYSPLEGNTDAPETSTKLPGLASITGDTVLGAMPSQFPPKKRHLTLTRRSHSLLRHKARRGTAGKRKHRNTADARAKPHPASRSPTPGVDQIAQPTTRSRANATIEFLVPSETRGRSLPPTEDTRFYLALLPTRALPRRQR